MNTTTNRIEKSIVLRVPREKAWAAIGGAQTFGMWFGMRFDGAFAPGARLTGKIVPTARRADAFEANEEGWGMVVSMLEKFVAA